MSEVNALELAQQQAISAIAVVTELETIRDNSKLIVEVNDENFDEVKKHKNALVKVRTSIEKKRKELSDPFTKAQKAIIEAGKNLIAICEPEEKRIAALVEEHENKAAIARQRITDERVEKLNAIGAINYGGSIGFNDLICPTNLLADYTDSEFTDFVSRVTEKVTRQKELEALAAKQREQDLLAAEAAYPTKDPVDAVKAYVVGEPIAVKENPVAERKNFSAINDMSDVEFLGSVSMVINRGDSISGDVAKRLLALAMKSYNKEQGVEF